MERGATGPHSGDQGRRDQGLAGGDRLGQALGDMAQLPRLPGHQGPRPLPPPPGLQRRAGATQPSSRACSRADPRRGNLLPKVPRRRPRPCRLRLGSPRRRRHGNAPSPRARRDTLLRRQGPRRGEPPAPGQEALRRDNPQGARQALPRGSSGGDNQVPLRPPPRHRRHLRGELCPLPHTGADAGL